MNENALASLDGTGSTLNPTISIVEPNSGRDFGSYSVPLRVNSAPAKVKNAVIMRHSGGTYAVLFYLPDDTNAAVRPDKDITGIRVSGFSGRYDKTFTVSDPDDDIDGVENSYDQSKFSAIVDQFIPLSGCRFVGVITDLPVGSVEPSCTVTLTDKWGLESSVAVSTSATTLTEIYVDPAAGDDGNPGSDVLPVKTIGRAMEKLSGMTGTTIILEGDITVPDTLSFTASHPDITLKGGGTSVTLTYSGTGRAITVFGGKLTLGENITITGADDGAVELTGGEFVMETGSTLSGNGEIQSYGPPVTPPDGGAVYIKNGTFTMKGGTINSNEANSGGAVYVDGGTFTMTGGTISNNDAASGGGVSVRAGSFTMSGMDAKIQNNEASSVLIGGMGGGVYVGGGTFTMTDGTISGNTAWQNAGGGIYVNGGNVSVSGGSIDNNNAETVGGGVYVASGSVEIAGSVTIKDNKYILIGTDPKGVELYAHGGNLTISGGNIQGQGNKKEIYSAKTFTITGKPTITNCTITLEQGAHIDVNGLNASDLSNVQVNLPDDFYAENAVLLENAGTKDICGKFSLGNPPPTGVWWIGLDDAGQNGILRHIDGTLSGDTVTVTTPPSDKDSLQDLVNDSADGGYKVEITGGGHIDIDSTVSVPGGADVAIKPGNGNTVNITASGATTVFDVQDGGSLTLGGGDGMVAIMGDPSEKTPVYNDYSPLIKVSGGGTVNIGENTEIKNNNAGRGVTVFNGGILNMTGGTISGNSGYNDGGGVLIFGEDSEFTMSGGEICDNKLVKNAPNDDPRQGGGVCVYNGAVFTLSGNAKIYKNSAQDGGAVCVKENHLSVDKKSIFNMEGGEIYENNSNGVGAVYIRAETAIMYMTGGAITNNTAASTTYAGGIYIHNGTFDGTGAQNASVTGNTIGSGTPKDISKTPSATYTRGNVTVGVGP